MRVVEVASTRTPFGVRFWDAVSDRIVTDGLDVVIRRRLDSGDRSPRRVRAFVTRGGVYAFRGLDGTRLWEMPTVGVDEELGDPLAPADRPGPIPHVVEVRDRFDRFVDLAFDVEVPQRGLHVPHPEARGGTPNSLYLFPSPARRAGLDLCGARAQLVDGSGRAVPDAVLLLRVVGSPSHRWAGLADADGNVVVLFPFPLDVFAPGTAGPDPSVEMEYAVLASPPPDPSPEPREPGTISDRFSQSVAPVAFTAAALRVTVRPGEVADLESPNAPAELRKRLVVSPN